MGIFVINILIIGSFFSHKNLIIFVSTILMMIIVYLVSKIRIIGITGGIGCGKSTITKHL